MTEVTDQEAVAEWAKNHKISDECVKVLLKEGFTSMEAISLLEKEDLGPKIPRGQNRLIWNAVSEMKAAAAKPDDNAHQPRVQDDKPEDDLVAGQTSYINEVLTQLQTAQSAAPTSQQPGIPTTSNLSWNDPQLVLKMAAGKTGLPSYYDITEFANLASAVIQEEVVGSSAGGAQLVWRTGKQKPKLSSLSIPQWSVANLAILSRLKEEGKLDNCATMDYLSYTTRVYQLFQRYDATSVYLYDREYRKLQAQLGFRWGTEVGHLQVIWLKEIQPQSQRTSTTNVNKTKGPVTAEGKIICKLFNAKSGCHYSDCKFVHKCSRPGCVQKHSAAVAHDQSTDSKN